MKFNELTLSEEIQSALAEMGFEEASPIQSQAIPVLLSGRDVIGQAQTGTGKTAAFGIPAIEKIDTSDKSVQCLVLCPTRELANQVCEEFKKIGKFKKGLKPVAIYGGESIERQIKSLQFGANVVIGTPGRVIDHLNRKTLNLSKVTTLILDEADEMLNMGFYDDIEDILSRTSEDRQTVFFSATMSKEIMNLTKRFQKNPELVKITRTEVTSTNIQQLYYDIKKEHKTELMCRLIEAHNIKSMLVFANTKKKVDELCEELQARGHNAEGLHGDMRQLSRNQVMTKFKSGVTNILIATDVAARGIDVESVEAVFNYDVPQDLEYYVHRIGRTGRAGRSGKAFTFICGGKDRAGLREIENYTKSKVEKGTPPSTADIINTRKELFSARLNESISSGDLDKYYAWVAELSADGLSSETIAAALLKMSFKHSEKPLEEIDFNDRSRSDRFERSDRNDRFSRGGDRDRNPRRDSFRGNDRPSGDRDFRGGDRDRAPRGERPSRPRSNEQMVRMFVNLGRADKIRPGDIVGAIAGETSLRGDQIGSIDIFDKYSFVDIPKDSVNEVIGSMQDNTIRGNRVAIEVAK